MYTNLLRHQIEAVVIVTSEHWHPDHTILLKRGGARVGIYFTESPYQDETHACNLSLADVVFTNERTSVDRLNTVFDLMESGARAEYLPLAYHPSLHGLQGADLGMKSHDVVFVGTAFRERISMLEGVDWSGIDLGLYGDWSLLIPRRWREFVVNGPGRHVPIEYVARAASLLPSGSPLWAKVRSGIVSHDRTADLYRRASIGLNLFRSSVIYSDSPTFTEGESMGPRLYELAATGTFCISEYRPEVEEVFGDLIPTFRTSDELRALIDYWLPRGSERAEISARLPGAVEGNTYLARARKVVESLKASKEHLGERTK